MDRPAKPWRSDVCDGLLLLLLASLPLAPIVYLGRAPLPDYLRWFAFWSSGGPPHTVWNALWYDAVGQYWPWRTLLHDSLRHGLLPYWNPYQFSGYSFVGNGQSALFYPLNWLCFGLLPVATGFRVTAVFHLWLAAYGTYRLLRELGGSRVAALTAGAAFGLSGFLVTWLMLPTLISSAAWLPVALAHVERARRTGDSRWAAGAGLAIGLSALAGHPQIAYYVGLTTALYAALRLLPRRTGAFCLSGGIAALLVTAVLLPVAELAPRSHRPPGKSDAGYLAFLGRAIPAERVVTLYEPRFFGSPAVGTVDPDADPQRMHDAAFDGAYWGLDRQRAISPGDYTEFNLYLGVLPLLLWLYALVAGPPLARWFAGYALVALILAFGAFPNRLLYFALPGYAAGAGPCRLALLWCFGAAVSAGLAVDALRAGPDRRLPWVVGALLLAFVAGCAIARTRLTGLGAGLLLEATSFRHLCAMTAAAVILAVGLLAARRAPRWVPLLVALDLVAFGWGFNPSCEPALLDPRPRGLEGVRNELGPARLLVLDSPRDWGFYRPPQRLLLPPNLATAARIRDVGGYDSLLPAAAKQAMFQAAGNRQPSPAINGNMLLLGEVDPNKLAGPLGLVLSSHMGRGWPGWRGSGEIVGLPLTPPRSRCLAWVPGRAPGNARIELDGLNRVSTTVPAAASALLLDSPDPGWRCYTGPAGTDALGPAVWTLPPFAPPYDRARFVPTAGPLAGVSGALRVQWVYQPMTVRFGLFSALAGLALAAGAVVACGDRR